MTSALDIVRLQRTDLEQSRKRRATPGRYEHVEIWGLFLNLGSVSIVTHSPYRTQGKGSMCLEVAPPCRVSSLSPTCTEQGFPAAHGVCPFAE